jgi:hypothetical protein
MNTSIKPELFNLPYSEIKKYGKENLTYGSLTPKGILRLVKELSQITNIYGFDLGCGDGDLIYYLQQLLPDSRWEGVEISDYRVSMQSKDVYIWQGDMLLENYKDYNVLHADNLCLDDIIADKLEEKISHEFNGLYITYRYPKNIVFLQNAIFIKTVLIETTWGYHPIHIFSVP